MNRLDQLAQPIRRNGEHMRAILERERRERELEMLDETASLGGGGFLPRTETHCTKHTSHPEHTFFFKTQPLVKTIL